MMGGRETPASSQIVLEVGAEGGSLKLIRRVRDGRSTFGLTINESVFQDLLPDEDLPAGRAAGPVGGTLEEALEAMGRYPWFKLYPLFVHPDVDEVVRAAVRSRNGDEALRRWDEILRRRRRGSSF